MQKFYSPLSAAVALFLGIAAVHAAPSAISLRVEQTNKSDMNPKDLAAKTSTQTHSLKIYLTNSSPSAADLKAKYTYFGREMKSHAIVSISTGEQAITVKPGIESFDLPSAKSTSVAEHFQGGGKGKPATKVEASGAHFVGYAVQIYQGSDLVAESYEPLSIKDEVGKASPAAAATPAKK